MASEIPTPLAGQSPHGVGVAFLRNRLASIYDFVLKGIQLNASYEGVI